MEYKDREDILPFTGERKGVCLQLLLLSCLMQVLLMHVCSYATVSRVGEVCLYQGTGGRVSKE